MMEAKISEFDRLVFGFRTLNFLDFAWLHERMAEASPKFEKDHPAHLGKVFPDLPFTPKWLAQAWSLYTAHTPHRGKELGSEVGFLYFILGLQEAWPKQTAFSEAVLRISMKEGARRAHQIQKIVTIFHESDGVLPVSIPVRQVERSTRT